MQKTLSTAFQKNLNKLIEELESFQDESNIWKTVDGITNSAGNLALHLDGNLNHFIGQLLGSSGYVRNREAEFSKTGISREVLIDALKKTVTIVTNTLESLTDEKLGEIYPFELFGKQPTSFYLLHFYGHLTYHLGQVNYLRRFLEH